MKGEKQRSRIPAVLLCVLVAALFALTWVPGVIRVNTAEGYFARNYYSSAFMGNTLFNVLSGFLLGCALVPLIFYARSLSAKGITIGAVMLETSALFGLSQFIYARIAPPGVYTTLSHAIVAGTAAAAVLAFLLCGKERPDGTADKTLQKRMALCCLGIAALLALTFVNRCWRWDWTDGHSYGNYYETGFIGCLLSVILTAAALNVALLHSVGLIRGRPIGCAVLLLAAALLSGLGILLHFVSSDAEYVSCVPLLPAYLITAMQLALALLLLTQGTKRKTAPN